MVILILNDHSFSKILKDINLFGKHQEVWSSRVWGWIFVYLWGFCLSVWFGFGFGFFG